MGFLAPILPTTLTGLPRRRAEDYPELPLVAAPVTGPVAAPAARASAPMARVGEEAGAAGRAAMARVRVTPPALSVEGMRAGPGVDRVQAAAKVASGLPTMYPTMNAPGPEVTVPGPSVVPGGVNFIRGTRAGSTAPQGFSAPAITGADRALATRAPKTIDVGGRAAVELPEAAGESPRCGGAK